MSRSKVFIAKKIPKEVGDYISKYCDCKYWSFEKKLTREKLFEEIKDMEGILESGIQIDEELLSHAPKLKIVCNSSVGYDNFNIENMKLNNVMGTNTPNVLDDTVADLVFSLILASARRISELDLYVKQGKWKEEDVENLYGVDVNNAVLGIIGMGRIGKKIAKRARFGFDMKILYHNRHRRIDVENEFQAMYVSLNALLSQSDYVVIMTPLMKETKNLIDYREFNLMKRTAIFINASRGGTINEDALVDALKNKKILAAGLDVYNKEPVDKDNPLLKMSNVVTLPHIGSATAKTRFDMDFSAAKSLVSGLTGKIPENLVPELRNISIKKQV